MLAISEALKLNAQALALYGTTAWAAVGSEKKKFNRKF